MHSQGFTIPEPIRQRLGPEKTQKRLELQERLRSRKVCQGLGVFALERFVSLNACINGILAIAGMKGRGKRNILDIRIETVEVSLPGLPPAFEGFRLLQLADLHCDLDPRMMQRIRQLIDTVPHDAAVLTGDYHNKVSRPFDQSLREMVALIPHLHECRFAVLGNHDFLEMVAPLEEAGLPFLLNESRAIQRDNQRIWICGIDDPHFFRTDDLERAREAVPGNEISILLSHSPENYRDAAALGYHLQLSGHTHGGQICAPGGVPIYRNAPGCRPEHLAGPWREKSMKGYTSRGTGSAGVPARFHCPPEITVHILRSSPLTGE